MQHYSKTIQHPFLWLIPAFFLLLIIQPESVSAKTATVADIIKTTSETNSPQLEISPELVSATKSRVPYTISQTPLILSKQTLQLTQENAVIPALAPEVVYEWVKTQLNSLQLNPENAVFRMSGDRVVEFNPGKAGITPDTRLTTLAVLQTIKQTTTNPAPITIVGIPIAATTTLSKTNTLGINEFLAGGISDFSNSSKNRLANIEAGMNQVKGVLVKPGEIFSFGQYLGDVTAEKGFKPEIVIKADGLKPELGGGICQVSSTLYRAVMQSGMAITQRRNHAFSVSHYFPAGTDATIYTPVTDLKFKNDTPAHVLIWPYYKDKTHLAFDLYGTSDGRTVIVDEPGHTDRKADGSLKASWTRHVTINGNTRDDVFKSNYLPPALFKKEEKFVVAEPTPTPTTAPTPTPTAN